MLEGLNIALVEDDEIMGSSILQRLELEGARVVWLKTIPRALGALRTPRQPFDAVICDIRLPDGSGEDLFHKLCVHGCGFRKFPDSDYGNSRTRVSVNTGQ